MKKAPLLLLGVLALPRTAAAQATPAPTYEDFAGTATPVTAGPPVPTSSPAPPAPTAGAVRVHVRSTKKREMVRLFRMDAPERYALVCVAPCAAELRPGDQLRATWNDGDEPHDFVLAAEAGRDIDVDVGPPKRGGLALGIVFTSLGGLGAITGLALTIIGAVGDSSFQNDLLVPGLVTLGVSTGLTFGGLSLIVNRSTEPRVWQLPSERRDAALPRAPSPVGLSLRF